MENDSIIDVALDGRLSEEQAMEYLESICDDKSLLNEIAQKAALASALHANARLKTASGIVDWICQKFSGNKALLSGVIALMLSAGALQGYEIKKGDTLWALGGGTPSGVQKILDVNPGLKADKTLKPGDKIVLPSEKKKDSATYSAVSGDTFSGIAKKFGLTVQELKALNPQVKNIDKISIGQKIVVKKGTGTVQKKTSNPASTQKIDAKTDYVARVIYAESGNSDEEMQMIAHVIANRMRLWHKDAYSIVAQKNQFSCTSGKDGNVKWKTYSRNLNKYTQRCYELATKIMKGDSSGMAGTDDMVFYCTKNLAAKGVGKATSGNGLDAQYGHPKGWGEYSVFTPVATSDNHVFYKATKKR